MKLLQSVRTHLLSRVNVTAIVGTRITDKHRPQGGTLPAISLHLSGVDHDHDLDGSAGTGMARVQVDSWAESDTDVDNLAEVVRLNMQGFVGTMGTHAIGVVLLDNELDLDDEPQDGGALPTYRRMQDYRIRFTETIPTF